MISFVQRFVTFTPLMTTKIYFFTRLSFFAKRAKTQRYLSVVVAVVVAVICAQSPRTLYQAITELMVAQAALSID